MYFNYSSVRSNRTNSPVETSNGVHVGGRETVLLPLPSPSLLLLNCSALEQVYQWVAYYATRYTSH